MIDSIQDFIDSKSLSENSKSAYFYDLQQFLLVIDGKVSSEKLALYEHSLSELAISAKKRKISAVNQFLYYLYEHGKMDHFYKLQSRDKLQSKPLEVDLLDLSAFYQESNLRAGQLIALLILELGLTPADMMELPCSAIDLNFSVLTLQKDGLVRVLQIPQRLLAYLESWLQEGQLYLFDNGGRSYSRQWFFNQLKGFLQAQGFAFLSAQALREQYILQQKAAGKSMLEVSRGLGLKSPITLEKYYKNGN